MTRRWPLEVALALLALAAIASALWNLGAARSGTTVEAVSVNRTPARVYRPASDPSGPVLVIAHGFAGSQQLMQSFALSAARNGYTAVTFDFLGHGRNPDPLTGSITEEAGATRALVEQTAAIARYARGLGDGRIAVLGHSMASDIMVRFAQATPEVAATIAVSMFSPVVTAETPRNLLVVVGEWEGMLKQEALRAVGLATAPQQAEPGVTYGDLAAGTGRRVSVSRHVEHASVLFSRDSLRETIDWLDRSFAVARAGPPVIDARGPWIVLLLAGVILLARQLALLLPRVAVPRLGPNLGAGLPWRRLWVPLLVPALVTPLLLRVAPMHFLPVLVGDYLAAHFATYGLLASLCLLWVGRQGPGGGWRSASLPALAAATLAVAGFGMVALAWPIDAFLTSFLPGPERVVLMLAMLVGTLLFFLSDEWITRGEGTGRGAYAASKLAFLVSLAIAVALDFERLFFLIIIVPVIVLFFLVYGLFSAWAYRQTGHPFVGGIVNALAFAWAIAVTFPLLAA